MSQPNDATACTYYRAELPSRHLPGITLSSCFTGDEIADYDAFIFHRVPRKLSFDLIKEIKARGKRLAWELDDDFWNIPSWNPASRAFSRDDMARLDEVLDLADMVIVSTQELASVVNRHTVRVCPNLVDLKDWQKPMSEVSTGPVKILWAGSIHHYGDLPLLVPIVQRILAKHGDDVRFLFMGDIPEQLATYQRISGSLLGKLTSAYSRVGFVDPVPLREYAGSLEDIAPDICLAPLAANRFNMGKSNCKYLEYSLAAGVTVASTSAPYSCINDGIDGFTGLEDVERAVDVISALIRLPALRRRVAAAARARVVADYSWQNGTDGVAKWKDALEELCQ